MGWISSVVSTARDKQARGTVLMKHLFAVSGINNRDCGSEQEARNVSDTLPSLRSQEECGMSKLNKQEFNCSDS